MMAPRFSLSPRLAAPGLALLLALAHVTIASAQGHTPDPYRPYNSVYDPYVFPTYPRADGYFPNQNRLEARSGPSQANQFQNFLDENRLGADPSGLSGSAGEGFLITGRTAASTPTTAPTTPLPIASFARSRESGTPSISRPGRSIKRP